MAELAQQEVFGPFGSDGTFPGSSEAFADKGNAERSNHEDCEVGSKLAGKQVHIGRLHHEIDQKRCKQCSEHAGAAVEYDRSNEDRREQEIEAQHAATALQTY